ncbi:DUF1294 domain-containing protein [Clostridium gasigenes]|uniref:DUF1294 domain-containing protein n=1 Tax=Clostridium gasigenes TaxID=94869 RepID=UPI001C0C87EE|nr:DUF1294 domain-containing protein [Clostridium gasigenes]MBU3103044.1 DUF1294 domain-containing protein [Clostridium gasigenes]
MQTLILLYLSIINLVGFLLMLVDKRRAIKHKWRISELNLFIVSIIGGSIGSYLGMHCFRHKTKSLKFTLGIPIIILIQGYLAIIL